MAFQGPSIQRRQQKKFPTATALQLGGIAVGGALGGLPGAGLGSTVGGLGGEFIAGNQQPQQVSVSQQLAQSIQALRTQPEEIRQQFSPPLGEAYFRARTDEIGGIA